MATEKQRQQAPRLVKAAELAARKAKEELERSRPRANEASTFDALLKTAARRVRSASDARAMLDALFDKPARA